PRCGTQLGPQQPSPRNNPGDIADEQTMVVKFPQKGQQAMLMQQPAPQHQTARTPHAVSQNGPAQARHTATATATAPPRTPPVTVMPGGPSSGVTPSSVASSPLFHPKWTVIIGISLILLIILMLVLFFQLMHAHAAAQHVPGPLAANMLLLINCASIPHLCD
ncbi:MAG: hypothetical protein J2P36_16020, partial [Ktedonobacteraceae bacterium]|nr:hypothetical protein [Ktedonobacteraceae bacterium]